MDRRNFIAFSVVTPLVAACGGDESTNPNAVDNSAGASKLATASTASPSAPAVSISSSPEIDPTQGAVKNPYTPSPYTLSSLGSTPQYALLTGDGLIGTATYVSGAEARIDVGRTDLYDHQPISNGGPLFGQSRLPLGYFTINFGDNVATASGAMNIYDGNAVATYLSKSKNRYTVTTRTLAGMNAILINITVPTGAAAPTITWNPAASVSPRGASGHPVPPSYTPNPGSNATQTGNNFIVTQQMNAGGSYGLGYMVSTTGNQTTVLASTFYSKTDTTAATQINTQLNTFDISSTSTLVTRHEQVWHQYYLKSAYRIPDKQIQSFYDMQLYKIRCAAVSGGPLIDLQGPWNDKTAWPGVWWNLNIQLTYSPFYTANRLDLASTLIDSINNNNANLIANVPKQYQSDSAVIGTSASDELMAPETVTTGGKGAASRLSGDLGDLTWALFYYWQHYRYSMDAAIGKNLFKILKRSVQFAMHLTAKNSNGQYEYVYKTSSPEYPLSPAFNTNYDVSLLKWGLTTLLSLNNDLNIRDSNASVWQDYLNNFIDYPQDKTGFNVATGVPFDVSHRHYSHLLMIYPLYLINWDQVKNRSIITTSINTWTKDTSGFHGFSWTGLASMQASMGNGDDALKSLQTFLNGRKNYTLGPNTLYYEGGPVMETPLSAMTSIQEMALQHWNGVTRVFPAIPSTWNDVSFESLRTDGAFLISGVRSGGVNRSVHIYSEQGGTIAINPNLGSNVTSSNTTLRSPQGGVYTLAMVAGQVIDLVAGGS